MTLLSGAAFSGILFLPLLVSAYAGMVELGAARAGFVSTVQLVSLALSSAVVGVIMSRVSLRTITVVGVALLVVANLVTIDAQSVSRLVVARSISGLGEGALLGVLHIIVARTAKPERSYAAANFVVVLWGVFLYPIVAGATMFGAAAVYSAVLALGLLAAFVTPLIPGKNCARAREERSHQARSGHWRASATLLVAVMIFYVGEGALWAYVAEIGVSIRVSNDRIGEILSRAFALSLIGPVFAHILSDRLGRVFPLTASIAALIVVAYVLSRTADHRAYELAVYAFYLVFIFAVIYSTTFVAAMDKGGRITAFVPTLRSLGTALGPAMAGLVLMIYGSNFGALGLVVIAFYAISAFMFIAFARRNSAQQKV